MFSISTTVDGVFHSDYVEPRMLLVHYLEIVVAPMPMPATPRGRAAL